MTKLQRTKLLIMLALFSAMLLFSSAGLFAIFSATTKNITCDRSKDMCTITRQRIIDLSPDVSYIRLSKIKRSYTKSKTKTRRTYSSTYGRFVEETKTHYYLCLETTEKKCLLIFDGTEFRLDDIYKADDKINSYLKSNEQYLKAKITKTKDILAGLYILALGLFVPGFLMLKFSEVKDLKEIQSR